MLARRRFAACALCAAGGILTATIGVRAQAPGFTRTVLNRTEFPGDKMVTLQVLVEIEPNVLVARHTHPGIEDGYLIEGGGVFGIAGAPDRPLAPGDAFAVPMEVPHYLQNGPRKSRVLSVYVVDKDKPLATPAPG